jgi:hypothetical protein
MPRASHERKNQTKVWATDPDGRRWEVYTVHEETVERDGSQESCCAERLSNGSAGQDGEAHALA